MNENETISFEDRVYANPTTSRDEQVDFIETLRETMGNNLNQINQGTYNLGSQLPSNLGGLSGTGETFETRYQRPQVGATAAQLRSTAQASALNTALSNLQNVYKKRYNDAMLKYQRRAASSGNNKSSGDKEGTVNITSPKAYNVKDSINVSGNIAAVNDPSGRLAVWGLNEDGSLGKRLGYADIINQLIGGIR